MSLDMSLPKLPGYTITPPPLLDTGAHTKKQTLTFKNGYAVPAALDGAAPCTLGVPVYAGAPSTAAQTAAAAPASAAAPRPPKWIEYDSQVLRFFGFFTEHVPGATEEPWRVRRATLLYYLADDTLQVDEPRQGNSGLPQGMLLKRHRVPKHSGGHLAPSDFVVGSSVHVYGREYHIVDADAFTREFGARRLALAHPPALPVPASPRELRRAERSKPSGLSRADEESPSRFAEALLGKAPAGKKLQQFLEHSSQVLRFSAVWDDRRSLYGDRRHFRLHFFLEDGTLEVVEASPGAPRGTGEAGGRGPAFLRRSQLPKVASGVALGARVPPEQCVGPADLRIGGFVVLHGRDFLLYAADGFTRAWYQEKMGASASEMEALDVSEPASLLPVLQLPPHNGFGSPEDTQQNCVRLIPQPPRKDIYKLMNRDRIVLRFSCKLVPGGAGGQRLINIDQERRFVLSYFMADDTLSVYEPPGRNTGIAGGKYLERGRVYHPGSTTKWYLETDLHVGARLVLHGRTFELLAADEFTYQYMYNNRHIFAQADPAAALAALRSELAGRPPELEAALQVAAAGQGGRVTCEQFAAAVHGGGSALSAHQAIAIFRRCSGSGDSVAVESLLGVLQSGSPRG